MTPQDELNAAIQRDVQAAAKRGAQRRVRQMLEDVKTLDPMAELCRRVHMGQVKHGYSPR